MASWYGCRKSGVAGEQKSAQSCLFVHHQFDQVVGVCDDLIGTVDPASAPLHQPESVSQGQRKQSQGNDW